MKRTKGKGNTILGDLGGYRKDKGAYRKQTTIIEKGFMCALTVAILLLIGSMGGVANAIEGTISGTEVSLSFTETITNEDGSDIQDLDHSNVYYTKDNDGIRVKATPSGQEQADIEATSPAGGGEVTVQIVVPVTHQEDVDITFVATHTDDAGNESIDSSPVVFNIDKQFPGAPQ